MPMTSAELRKTAAALRAAANALQATAMSTVALLFVPKGKAPFNKDTIDEATKALQMETDTGFVASVRDTSTAAARTPAGKVAESVVLFEVPEGREKDFTAAVAKKLKDFTVTTLPKFRKAEPVTKAA